jgi:hypothetical protein
MMIAATFDGIAKANPTNSAVGSGLKFRVKNDAAMTINKSTQNTNHCGDGALRNACITLKFVIIL